MWATPPRSTWRKACAGPSRGGASGSAVSPSGLDERWLVARGHVVLDRTAEPFLEADDHPVAELIPRSRRVGHRVPDVARASVGVPRLDRAAEHAPDGGD